ncbi:MAG: PEP-CTERM sorting domain-containing protein [Bdellovibrionales bacterium]|nr:PEP-CTERM sorting domain-containing protein [Massilia sp.]
MKLLIHALVLASTCAVTAANASIIIVTPASTGPGLNKWQVANIAGGATAAITTTNPRDGGGSVEMSMSTNGGKADYVYTWGYDASRTLGNLNTLSYDWFRSVSSSMAAHFHPAFRLRYDADGNSATTGDTGYLIYENIYNGNNVVEGVWRTDNILGANFWMRQFSPTNNVENYETTLQEWMTGPRPGAPADALSANTAILGMEFGIGSGWGSGTFNGFVDNVTLGFGNNITTFNFEAVSPATVPEPGSMALLALGAFGFVAARRRKQM